MRSIQVFLFLVVCSSTSAFSIVPRPAGVVLPSRVTAGIVDRQVTLLMQEKSEETTESSMPAAESEPNTFRTMKDGTRPAFNKESGKDDWGGLVSGIGGLAIGLLGVNGLKIPGLEELLNSGN